MVKVEVEGLKELERDLLALGNGFGMKTLRSGLRTASKPMFNMAKGNALVMEDSGATAEAMRIKTAIDSRNSSAVVYIGPSPKNKKAIALWDARHNSKEPTKGLHHFHLLEYGGGNVKSARPFLRDAFDSQAMKLLNNFKDTLRKQIAKTIKSKAYRASK